MLELRHLHAWWGAAQVLFDVSLVVGSGEWVVLQGLNGAGKSSLLQTIMGLGPRSDCVLRYQNQSIADWPTHRRARFGLGYVPEDRRLFTALTVLENLQVAAHTRPAVGAPAQRQTPAQRLARVLELFPVLASMLQRPAAQMSGGEQQMLSLARTLMTGPTLLLLDEPCEGIAPVLVESIRDALLALRAQGISMLVAEQNAILAGCADRVITLSAGHIANPSTP